jgi:hypothetical protein
VSFGLLYLLFYFFMHPIDSHHNTTFFLKLTGSNISLWCYFWIDFCLNIFRNMLSSGLQHSVRQRALWKTDLCWNHMFQRSQILDELIPPAHTESSITSSSRFAPARDSMVNLLYRLVDQLFRGFHFSNDQFRARRLKWLKLFSLCFPVQELEAKVFQIQLFIWFSLCYLISVDQQDLVLGRFLFLSFGPLADSSLVSYCFGF